MMKGKGASVSFNIWTGYFRRCKVFHSCVMRHRYELSNRFVCGDICSIIRTKRGGFPRFVLNRNVPSEAPDKQWLIIQYFSTDYCMVQFVKPNLLGKYNEYLNRFVNPITNGQYTDSTEHDIRVMKRRSHVLHKMLDGAVQVIIING